MTDCKNCNYTDEYCASGECTSQSPRNHLATTSQVSDLTEQMHKGELPEGWYWVKRVTWSECINMLYNWRDTFLDGDVPVDNDQIIEVLAEVPDYVEWQNMVNCACEEHEANHRLLEENAQLKEKIERLEKQLEIAVDALDLYKNLRGDGTNR